MSWQDRINRAKKTGVFTENNYNEIYKWKKTYDALIHKFYVSIITDDIPTAEKTYKEIQRLKI